MANVRRYLVKPILYCPDCKTQKLIKSSFNKDRARCVKCNGIFEILDVIIGNIEEKKMGERKNEKENKNC